MPRPSAKELPFQFEYPGFSPPGLLRLLKIARRTAFNAETISLWWALTMSTHGLTLHAERDARGKTVARYFLGARLRKSTPASTRTRLEKLEKLLAEMGQAVLQLLDETTINWLRSPTPEQVLAVHGPPAYVEVGGQPSSEKALDLDYQLKALGKSVRLLSARATVARQIIEARTATTRIPENHEDEDLLVAELYLAYWDLGAAESPYGLPHGAEAEPLGNARDPKFREFIEAAYDDLEIKSSRIGAACRAAERRCRPLLSNSTIDRNREREVLRQERLQATKHLAHGVGPATGQDSVTHVGWHSHAAQQRTEVTGGMQPDYIQPYLHSAPPRPAAQLLGEVRWILDPRLSGPAPTPGNST